MDYITVKEAAEKWNISDRLVQKYCAEGRIEGLKKFGKSWGIPSSADKPKDPRKEKRISVSLIKDRQLKPFRALCRFCARLSSPGNARKPLGL